LAPYDSLRRSSARFEFFHIDLSSGELFRSGARVPIQEQPLVILRLLLEAEGRVVTRQQLRAALWPQDTFVDFEHGVNTAVKKLRQALADSAEHPKFVETLPKLGYRFIAAVDWVPDDNRNNLRPRVVPIAPAGPKVVSRFDWQVHATEQTLSTPGSADLIQSDTGTENGKGNRSLSPKSEFLDSIAILPFENAGDDPEMDYLSDGMTVSIINNLSQLQRLRVVPRTTVCRYKGRLNDVAQAGRELHVRVVLSGRVSQRSDALSVNVELIDTANECHLWGEHFKGNPEDIFRIQAEIAAQITNKLRLELNDEETKQLSKRPTVSREAYHLLLKSLYWANKWTPDGIQKGVDYARRAIDVDPVYAEAWTALAYLFVLIGFLGSAPSTEVFARAKAAAAKALDINEGDVGAHATLAYVRLVHDWDWLGAREEVLRAIELGPNLANGHWVYSHWYLTQGLYVEAMREARVALDLDPLSVQFSYQVGAIHFFSRQYDLAIEQFHSTNELDPRFVASYQLLAAAYAQKGMRNEAILEIERGLKLAGNSLRSEAMFGVLSAMAGDLVEARRVLDKSERELKPPFSLAYPCAGLHALLGEKDEAFACLDIARQGHSVQLAYVAITQELESLHDDPRFREMLRSMGFPLADLDTLALVTRDSKPLQ
jgi:TolB-like protein/DNA-binding winged helix-turn-helix (wHTH) protein